MHKYGGMLLYWLIAAAAAACDYDHTNA